MADDRAACGAIRGPPRESPPAAPGDANRTEALLRENANLEPDPELLDRYRDIDARYFARGLPPASLRWEPRLAEVGPLIAENFRLEGATDGHVIILNPAIRGDEQQLKHVLCHEIVHVAVWKQDRGLWSRVSDVSAQPCRPGRVRGSRGQRRREAGPAVDD